MSRGQGAPRGRVGDKWPVLATSITLDQEFPLPTTFYSILKPFAVLLHYLQQALLEVEFFKDVFMTVGKFNKNHTSSKEKCPRKPEKITIYLVHSSRGEVKAAPSVREATPNKGYTTPMSNHITITIAISVSAQPHKAWQNSVKPTPFLPHGHSDTLTDASSLH